MAATITKGYTFSTTEWVTAGKLHTLVDGATIAGIVNAEISNSAAIAYSKLNLVGAIKNSDISAAAGIPYSKLTLTDSITDDDIASASAITYGNLNLSDSILDTDINSAAAIAYSKLNLADSIVDSDVNTAAAIGYSKLNLTDSIIDSDVNTAAAVAYSKLDLADSIVDADINTAAAIAYSKLDLADSIVDADINSAAAIVYSKLDLAGDILDSDINASADIDLTKMASGASASIPITDSNGEQAYQIISGDFLINASGVGAIATGVIVNTDINASADIALSKLVSAASGSFLIAGSNGEYASTLITGDVLIGSDGTSTAVSATSTSKGIAELAIASEVNTGTDAGRVITPDALAGSNLGRKIIEVVPFDRTSSIASGDGKADLVIPPALNGMDLVYINGAVLTAGSSGSTTLMLYNVTDGVDMLTTAVSIPSGTTGFGVSGGINATGKSVATGDWLRLDLDSVCTTAEKGLLVTLEFSLP